MESEHVNTLTLSQLRSEIDRCNRDLLDLLCQRARLAMQAREIKEMRQGDLFDAKRQADMLLDLAQTNPGPLSDDAVVAVFRYIFQHILDLMAEGRKNKLKVHRREQEPDRIIEVAGHRLGARPVYLAGPCSIESEEQLEAVATRLAAEGVEFLRGGAFKPRTSPYAFQGLGEQGLQILRRVATNHGMAAITEVTDPRAVDLVAEYADVLQVGARNMYNYELLRELSRVSRPVLLKRSFAATLEEYLLAAEYLVAGGNDRVILCERGIRTFVRETRSTLDLSAVPLLRQTTSLPVVVDVSHAAGRTDILAPLVRAAFAVGASGVMLEVHPCPPAARSDCEQQLTPDAFARLKCEVNQSIMDRFPII